MGIVGTKRIVVDLDPSLYVHLLDVKKRTGQTIRAQITLLLQAEMRASSAGETKKAETDD